MTATVRPRAPRGSGGTKHPHVDRATRYAQRVVAGKIPACLWVRLACQRHLDDLRRSREKGYPYRFDKAKAERVCQFAELFPHVKGHWAIARPGKPDSTLIRLEDWQCFIQAVIYGWVEKQAGLRRFRVAYIEVPRKNAKSTIAAVDGLYGLAADGEYGAEIYSGATSEKQALEIFRPAKQMAEKSPDFLELYGVEVHAKSLAIPANGSRFEPVVGKPGDGASPSLALVDEFHEHDDADLYDTMITGMGARRQPLMLVITTAGSSIDGPCYALHEDVQAMLKGTKPNDRLFGIIYTIDDTDRWDSEAALRKANPNFDVSVSGEYLRQQMREAVASSRKQATFKTKHLNVWVTARQAWLNMEWWHQAADRTLIDAMFEGEPCIVAGDLASKIDTASVMRIFRRIVDEVEHYYLFGRYYVPEPTVQDPGRQTYQGWVHDGYLIATEGDEIHQERIKADLLADARRFEVLETVWDPWGATKLKQELADEGLVTVDLPQNVTHFSEPMKTLEAAIKAGRVHHDGNPVLTWMMGNVTVKPDAKENVFPRKERAANKIDGAVAAIMALNRWLARPSGASVYDSEGLKWL